MYNSKQDERRMALAITHYAYRNTILEDYHSQSIKMDQSFYKKIYKTVYNKLQNVKALHKYVLNFRSEVSSQEEFGEQLNAVPEELQVRFIRYFQDIVATIEFRYGSAWEPAKALDNDIPNISLASYVLSGHFAECCEKGDILNDKTMCYINKDVHNRIYTLLINGRFN